MASAASGHFVTTGYEQYAIVVYFTDVYRVTDVYAIIHYGWQTMMGAYAYTYKSGKNSYGSGVQTYTYRALYVIVTYGSNSYNAYFNNGYFYFNTKPVGYYVIDGYYYYYYSISYVSGYRTYISGYASYWVEDKSYAYIHHVNDVSYSYKYYYGK